MYINSIKQQYYNYFSLDIDLHISLSAGQVWAPGPPLPELPKPARTRAFLSAVLPVRGQ